MTLLSSTKVYSLFRLCAVNVWIVSLCIQSCASTNNQKTSDEKIPKISSEMTVEEALQAGIDFGGDTARDVRKLISKRQQWPQAEKILVEAINEGVIKYENIQLVNAVMIYLSGPVNPSSALFQKLVQSERPIARQLGWQMAASLPGKTMQKAIDQEVSRALVEGDDKDVILPHMAAAVSANRMTSAYTLVRRGLMTVGHEEFASAMVILDPTRASDDFIEYLSTCPPEELRQISVSSINVYSATVALNHLIKSPPVANNARIEVVFYYAISRNSGLAELGTKLVDILAVKDQRGMAITLSRLPTWAQVAFIETSRRSMTPTRRVFLSELMRVSPQAEVADELGEFQL